MTAIALPTLIVPSSPWIPTRYTIEEGWDELDRDERRLVDRILKTPSLDELVRLMSGSIANDLSKKLADAAMGAATYTADSNYYAGLWTAALDSTFTGATGSESAYTSYARLLLANNSTIFAAGSGTTSYTKTNPSDATKSFAASTGGTSTITYLGLLNGNAGTSSDKGRWWCTVTSVTINSGDTPQLAQNAVSTVWGG